VLKNLLLINSHINVLQYSYMQRTGGEVVEEITEIPTTPPPRIQERTVVEPAGPPQIIKKVIRVPPRGGSYGNSQQLGVGVVPSAGSFSSIQQAASGYQQHDSVTSATAGGASYQGGYAGAATGGGYESVGGAYGSVGGGYGSVGGGYGAVGGGYGAVGGGYGSVGGGFQQQSSGFGGLTPLGPAPQLIPGANCFYV
jgi:hypothetical protein